MIGLYKIFINDGMYMVHTITLSYYQMKCGHIVRLVS